VRLSEVANVYRNERSGVLHGLLRVRGLSMDDAHIFCTPDQVEDEIFLCLDQVDRLVRETFGFELDFEVSTRPPDRLGDDAIWDRAETTLKRALDRKQIAYRIDEGGRAPQFSSISTCPSASGWNTPAPTTARIGRQ
jgi:threonyl-tRNA synthetase